MFLSKGEKKAKNLGGYVLNLFFFFFFVCEHAVSLGTSRNFSISVGCIFSKYWMKWRMLDQSVLAYFRLEFNVMIRAYKHTRKYIFISPVHDRCIHKNMHKTSLRLFLIIHRLMGFCVLRNPIVHHYLHGIPSLIHFTFWESALPKCPVLSCIPRVLKSPKW
jgi:hypothetical protein